MFRALIRPACECLTHTLQCGRATKWHTGGEQWLGIPRVRSREGWSGWGTVVTPLGLGVVCAWTQPPVTAQLPHPPKVSVRHKPAHLRYNHTQHTQALLPSFLLPVLPSILPSILPSFLPSLLISFFSLFSFFLLIFFFLFSFFLFSFSFFLFFFFLFFFYFVFLFFSFFFFLSSFFFLLSSFLGVFSQTVA